MNFTKKSVIITGSSGLIGQNLSSILSDQEYKVIRLNRIDSNNKSMSPRWDISQGSSENDSYPETLIHLAGENISAKRWSKKQKLKIYNSRILGTRNLVKDISALKIKPKTFICASAIGFYGNRGTKLLTEKSLAGNNFSSRLVIDWENETHPLLEHGIRVVNLRFGVVLSQESGALKKMLLPYKLGLGGAIGNGKQFFSWVSINDVISAIEFIIKSPAISGPINITSPYPVTNKAFSTALAKQLKRPAFFTMPAPICRLLFGEMADELLLSSQNVIPEKLLANGFKFSDEKLPDALTKILE